MPVLSRIDWIARQIDYGRIAHVVVGQARDPSKVKFRIVLQPPGMGAVDDFAKQVLLHTMQQLRVMVLRHSAVDRGHKFSDGRTEVGLWISQVPAREPLVSSSLRAGAAVFQAAAYRDSAGDTASTVGGAAADQATASAELGVVAGAADDTIGSAPGVPTDGGPGAPITGSASVRAAAGGAIAPEAMGASPAKLRSISLLDRPVPPRCRAPAPQEPATPQQSQPLAQAERRLG